MVKLFRFDACGAGGSPSFESVGDFDPTSPLDTRRQSRGLEEISDVEVYAQPPAIDISTAARVVKGGHKLKT